MAVVTALSSVTVLAATAHAVTVVLNPSSALIPMVSATAPVAIHTNDDTTGVSGFSIGLTFDPTIVHITTVAQGSLVVADPSCTFIPNPDNATGKLCIQVACATSLSGSGDFATITFQGQGVGTSNLVFSSAGCTGTSPPANGCQFNEGNPACTPTDGSVAVLGASPTSTNTPLLTQTPTTSPTLSFTPTRTPTLTPTNTGPPAATPTQTSTASFTPTVTITSTPSVTLTPSISPTQTATLVPSVTGTATSAPTQTPTPSITATRTPSLTPSSTPSPTPIAPIITSGAVDGSTRVFGHGAGNVATLQIFNAGPDMVPGGGDDTLIGTGKTDPGGNFNDGQDGIAVIALVAGEKIFAFDADHNVAGPVVVVAPPNAVPTLGSWGGAALGLSLGLLLALRTRVAAGRRSQHGS